VLEGQKIEGGIRVIDLNKGWSNEGSASFLAVMVDGYVVMGKTESVDSWFSLTRSSATASDKPAGFQQTKPNENAVTITYANDSTRVSSFVSTINLLRGHGLSDEQSVAVMNATKASSFSITESRLHDGAIERTTRSPFGQLSTLMSLLQSDTSAERK